MFCTQCWFALSSYIFFIFFLPNAWLPLGNTPHCDCDVPPRADRLAQTDLKVGFPIQAGCGNVTGSIRTIRRQQGQVRWECLILSHPNDVPHLDTDTHTFTPPYTSNWSHSLMVPVALKKMVAQMFNSIPNRLFGKALFVSIINDSFLASGLSRSWAEREALPEGVVLATSPWCSLILSGRDFRCEPQTPEPRSPRCLLCVSANPRSPAERSAFFKSIVVRRCGHNQPLINWSDQRLLKLFKKHLILIQVSLPVYK